MTASAFFNRVYIETSTTGQGTIALGNVVNSTFLTFADAGATNGVIVTYIIEEGNDFEIGQGTYSSAGPTLSRDTVRKSKIGGVAGTTKMTLSGNATVRDTISAEDMAALKADISPEDYGAVGDGVTDDLPSFLSMYSAVQTAGGGRITFKPNTTYYWDISAYMNGSTIQTFSNLKGFVIRGNGAKIYAPYNPTVSGKAIYAHVFQGSEEIEISNLRVESYAEDGSDAAAARGLGVFWFESACRRIAFRNFKQTGGRIGIEAQFTPGSLSTTAVKQIHIENYETDQTQYPLVLYGAEDITIENMRTNQAARSLFLVNVHRLKGNIYSNNNYADDLLISCDSYYGAGCEDIDLSYTSYSRTDVDLAGYMTAMVMRATTTSGGAYARNVRINYDADCAGGGGITGLFRLIRQLNDGAGNYGTDAGVARSHIVDGLRLSGALRNVPAAATSLIVHNDSWPSGETIRGVSLRDLTWRGNAASAMVFDGTAFDSPLSLENIDSDGLINLSNFAAGMVQNRNVLSANYNAVEDSVTTRGDANYTILPTDRIIFITAAFTAPRTFTLPNGLYLPNGREITIIDQVGAITAVNTLTIQRSGSDVLNNAATSIVLANVNDGITFKVNNSAGSFSSFDYPIKGIEQGGTGASTASAARTNLGLGTLATQSGTFSGTSSGTNTGDQTNISGNAATVTTNANLTGAVTSVGNATSLGSFTSAQLASALTDETGSGANVFATAPTFTTNITSPLVIGGTASGSFAEIRSTSGTGSGDYVTITGGTNGATEFLRLNSSGIGFGKVPANAFDVLKSINSNLQFLLTNSSGGNAAQVNYRVVNDAGNNAQFGLYGSGTTAYGALLSGIGYIYTSSGAGLTFMVDNAAGPIRFAAGGNTEQIQFTTTGNIAMQSAAGGLVLKRGANGRCGTFVANGVTPVTVSNTSIAITDGIIISLNTVGGTVGVQPHVATITASSGFTVVCTALDTSTYNYNIISNAA